MTEQNTVIKKKSSSKGELILSKSAQAHLLKQLANKSNALGVKLSLKKTGCSGLSYAFDFIETEDSTDRKLLFGELKVYIDNKSYPYLKGLQIDFVKEGLNNKYLYKNPNQTGECGCGESFTID